MIEQEQQAILDELMILEERRGELWQKMIDANPTKRNQKVEVKHPLLVCFVGNYYHQCEIMRKPKSVLENEQRRAEIDREYEELMKLARERNIR